MPKVKTRKAVAKRFTVTASGSVKRACSNKEHILTKKSRARKNRLKKGSVVDSSNLPAIKACLPKHF